MTTVSDVMTRDVISVPPDAPLKEVVTLLIGHRVGGLPVVQDGRVIGVISETDLLAKEAAATEQPPSGFLSLPSRRHRFEARRDAETAAEAMTSPALTIGSKAAVAEAARLMVDRHINRLPVVDDHRLVGIVSRADVLRPYLRTDDDLADAIRREVLLDSLWLDPATFEVCVDDGLVRVVGAVERRSTAEIMRDLVTRTPGVVGVTIDVSWTLDDRDSRRASAR
jgi:CBS domain-containing protein